MILMKESNVYDLAIRFLNTLDKVPERPTSQQVEFAVKTIIGSRVGVDVCLSYDGAYRHTRIDVFGIANTIRGTRILSIPVTKGRDKKIIDNRLATAIDDNWELYVLELANSLTRLYNDDKSIVNAALEYTRVFAKDTFIMSEEADERYLRVAKILGIDVDLDKLHYG